MDFNVRSTIYFFSLDNTAVDFSTTAKSNNIPLAEQFLYACLVLRQLVNMKGDRFASRLCQFLLSVGKHPFQFQEDDNVFVITDYRGESAKKHFVAQLQIINDRPQFNLSTKGLGIFERNLRYYASASVMVLYYYFVRKRKEDITYQTQIARIGSICTGVYLSNQLNVANQTVGAVDLVKRIRAGEE